MSTVKFDKRLFQLTEMKNRGKIRHFLHLIDQSNQNYFSLQIMKFIALIQFFIRTQESMDGSIEGAL